jgi:hypothetical protein
MTDIDDFASSILPKGSTMDIVYSGDLLTGALAHLESKASSQTDAKSRYSITMAQKGLAAFKPEDCSSLNVLTVRVPKSNYTVLCLKKYLEDKKAESRGFVAQTVYRDLWKMDGEDKFNRIFYTAAADNAELEDLQQLRLGGICLRDILAYQVGNMMISKRMEKDFPMEYSRIAPIIMSSTAEETKGADRLPPGSLAYVLSEYAAALVPNVLSSPIENSPRQDDQTKQRIADLKNSRIKFFIPSGHNVQKLSQDISSELSVIRPESSDLSIYKGSTNLIQGMCGFLYGSAISEQKKGSTYLV